MIQNFEDQFMDIQSDIISYCLKYSQGSVDTIYVYIAIEPDAQMLSTFFSKDHKILNIQDVNSDKMMMVRFLKEGKSFIKDIKDLCEENGTKTPTQMKLYYDVNKNHLKADYSYDFFYTGIENVSPLTFLDEWKTEIQREIR